MKKQITSFTAMAFAFVMLFSACAIEKRHYRRGFHITTSQKVSKHTVKAEPAKQTKADTSILTSTVVDSTFYSENTSASLLTKAIVIEKPVAIETHTKKAADSRAVAPVKEKGSKKTTYKDPYDKKAYKASPKGFLANLGDEKIIAILLCILLGWIGVHRFYLGFPISGIIYILLFLAWVLLWGFLGPIGWVCGVLLFVFIIIDLIFLIFDKPLFFSS